MLGFSATSFVERPLQDDVSASHFFDDSSEWDSLATSLCPTLQSERVRINKKLAHLTYLRLSEEDGWNIGPIVSELEEAIALFLARLTPERKTWFDSV